MSLKIIVENDGYVLATRDRVEKVIKDLESVGIVVLSIEENGKCVTKELMPLPPSSNSDQEKEKCG